MKRDRQVMVVFVADGVVVDFHVVVDGLFVAQMIIIFLFAITKEVMRSYVYFFFILFLIILLPSTNNLPRLCRATNCCCVLFFELGFGVCVAEG